MKEILDFLRDFFEVRPLPSPESDPDYRPINPPMAVGVTDLNGTSYLCAYFAVGHTPEFLFVECGSGPPLRFLRRTGRCIEDGLKLVPDGRLDAIREYLRSAP